MSFFPILTTVEFQETYPELHNEVLENLGINFVPKIFRCLAATNPSLAMASWTMVKNNLCAGELPRTSKEILFSYIAKTRQCEYCHIAHLALAAVHGYKDQNIAAIVDDITLVKNPALKSILEFSKTMLSNTSPLTESSYNQLDKYGFSLEEITELIGMISCSLYMVNIADSLMIEVDEDFKTMARSA